MATSESRSRALAHSPSRRAPIVMSNRSSSTASIGRPRSIRSRGRVPLSSTRTCVGATIIIEGDPVLKEPTLEKLHALRLRTMAAAWEEQQRNPDVVAMSFDERLALLVDAECMARENDRVGRALKEAKLRIAGAAIEGIDYPPARELDRTLVRHL